MNLQWRGGARRNGPRDRAEAQCCNQRRHAGPDIRSRFQTLGAVSKPNSPAEFAAFIAAEHRKWSELAASAHIKLE
jgi:tripartite-type tricarboxylate transporter receptor subunit TctC